MLILLLLEAGDIEMNPGPNIINNSLSILHSNIRSIRNKLDYITENFLDFDILCFTESHLDANVTGRARSVQAQTSLSSICRLYTVCALNFSRQTSQNQAQTDHKYKQ